MNNSEWCYIPAKKFCLNVTDGTHDTPKKSDAGKPLITSKHIKGSEIDFESAYLISEDDFNFINKRSAVEQWDVIISMIGAYCGYCFVESNSNIQYAVKNVGLFKAGSKVNAQWLYYYLNSQIGKAYLDAIKSGSTQPYLTLGGLRNLPILVPRLESVKQNIINVVSTIDKKIEINNRINAELEAMAKTLYDYWFVQFDFPDENGKPYKSSGGKMVYSEELRREIPVGWDVSNILKVSELIGGGTPSKEKPLFWGGEIPFFTPTDITQDIFQLDTEEHITDDGLKNCSSLLFDKGTVFITARGSVGKLTLTARKMAMNQSCYALMPKSGYDGAFLYFLSQDLIHYLKVKSSGSVFKSIVSNDIKFTLMCIPDKSVVQLYSQIAVPLFEKILNTSKENQRLAALRDWLLPMLMNGQVRVEHLDVAEL